MQIVEKLKSRWGIQSNWQVLIIMAVFSFAGMTVVFARKWAFNFLGVVESDPFWFKAVLWILLIFPLYNILLLAYGTLLGQFDFFWAFFKRSIGRFIPTKSGS
ncbi:DUF6787 family protein [Gracilimonas mengyeensis]|uniref:DUF6787 domain-containing protein n=1 Tax=Gracilimonas mengyeensis TaxID=1302730 RepID=A0A521CUN8_9BACT|nr:DUF6787 family protein [Gracilimonas mengyeensis]SMO63135.1 hypothetical protein SAMN06265219_106116 [Gracilimonas mengyeensis]